MALGFQYGRIPFMGLRRAPTEAELLISQATVLNDYSPTFTRASTAYDPYNRTTAASGVRRRRPLPISKNLTVFADLIESSQTNLLLWSQDTTNAIWVKTDTTVTGGQATAPNGTATLDLCTEGSVGTANVSQSATITAGQVVALSRYLKIGNTPWVRLKVQNGTDSIAAWFNLSTGTKGSVANAGTSSGANSSMVEEPVGSGIYRCTITGIVNTSSTSVATGVRTASADASNTTVSGGTYYVGWHQCEQMAASATTGFPSSYIATTTATVTRAADELYSTYNLPLTGTLLFLAIPYGWSGDQDGVSGWRLFEADDTGTSLASRFSSTQLAFRRCDAGGFETSNVTHGLTGGLGHIAGAWDSASVRSFVAGVQQASVDTTLTPPFTSNNTKVWIGCRTGGALAFNGWVALLAWPNTLSSAQLLSIYSALPVAA